jgi:ligand-binding sensor domain-containing protein/serine phosphatase RsbU (regulator of sigma subunit)
MLKRDAKILFIILIWYHFFAIQCYTQPAIPNVDILGSTDGLSQVSVTCMLQDSRGFLWIGTQDGLNLYDGRSFRIFQQDPADSNSIIHSNVKAIVEDSNGNIWIGTINGLCMFDRRKEIFINPLRYSKEASYKLDQNIYGLCLDYAGILWIKTLDALFSYNIKTKKFTQSFKEKGMIDNNPDQVTLPVITDRKGNLIVGSKEGLKFLESKTSQFRSYLHSSTNFKSISDNTITALLSDPEGRIWVGTQHGLNEFDPAAETFHNIFLSKLDTGKANSILSLVRGEKGIIWIGTPEAIYKYSTNSGTLERNPNVYWENNLIPVRDISAMLLDRSSILWVGITQGLIKYDTKPRKFSLYRKNDLGFPGFSSNDIGAIMEDIDGKIWFGTWGQGLNVYDRATRKVVIYSNKNKDPRLRISDDYVRVIFKDRNQVIYLGTIDGFDVFDRKTKSFSPFCNKFNDASCNFLNNNRKYCVIEDRAGNFWMGTSAGLHEYDAKFNVFRNYNFLSNNSRNHELKIVYSLCEDKEGYIWIGTDNGLIRFNPVKLESKIYNRSEISDSSSLSSNSIYSLYEDSGGTLWAGTASGLDKYDPHGDCFKVFTVRNGLPNNVIYAIVEDNHRMLWMTTNRGIVRMNTTKETFTSFDISDGMQNYEFNIQASYKSNTGEIFFGGIAGINSFFPDSLKINKHIPQVAITSFELNTTAGVKKVPVFGLEQITLPYNSRTFTLEFATLEFTDPARNHYKYKLSLKGEEGTWIDAGTRNYASYTNVPPGEYYFTVRGSNSDQVWSQQETVLELTVKNSPFLTKTAYTIYSLVILLIIFLYIQIRTQKLKNDNKSLREKQQAAIKIARQKEELTIKNKNITDSLNYARRIQQALMPSERSFKKILPNSFVLHRPKDIVSGDFYWINETKDLIYVSAIDCTGHGVPGAFMSIIGFELFRKIASSPEKYNPDKILNLLNDDFAQIFKDVDGISLKDGMDIALCIIDKQNWSLQFSGAFNPLYIIREDKIIELKGDRFSVGLDDEDEKHQGFTSQHLQLLKNDMIYLFSDGFADQFGGPEGKKFKYRRFRHILLNIHTLPLSEQKSLLDQTLDNWRGSIEQVDDVLVIGFKPAIGD